MYGTLFNPADRERVVDRISRLTPASQRRWGTLTAPRAVAHMADQLRIGLGEIPVRRARGPLRFAPLRFLFIHVLPWPKGRAKGPRETFTNAPSEFAADLAELTNLVRRFSVKDVGENWPLNPVFGHITGPDWGVLSYRHLDHHLRQFGV